MWEGECLIIPRKVARAMVTTAVQEQPREMCGVLVGWGEVNAQFWIPIPNIHPRGDQYYQMDPEMQIRAWHWAQECGLSVIAIVHSHVNGEAVLSEADMQYAAYEDMFYVVFGLQKRHLNAWTVKHTAEQPELTSHRVVIDHAKRGLGYCWSHNKYEDDLRSFRVCFECKHVFQSELDLIAAHNDVIRQINRDNSDADAQEAQRAEDVFCCPFCVHDF